MKCFYTSFLWEIVMRKHDKFALKLDNFYLKYTYKYDVCCDDFGYRQLECVKGTFNIY